MHITAVDGTADLGIHRTQFTVLMMRQGWVLFLFKKSVLDAMRESALLREQQGKGEQQGLEQTERSH